MYARPTVDQQVLSFGVSGKLWREVLVLYDRQTLSLWSQRQHLAIAGPLSGSGLEVLESTVTDWATWKAEHPSTSVVVEPGGSGTLELWRQVSAAMLVLALLALLVGRRRRRRIVGDDQLLLQSVPRRNESE